MNSLFCPANQAKDESSIGSNLNPIIGEILDSNLSAMGRARKLQADAENELRRDWDRGIDGMIERVSKDAK